MILIILSMTGCVGKGPKIELCISDPANGGMSCRDKDGNGPTIKYYEKTENYICTNPDDFKKLIAYCKSKK